MLRLTSTAQRSRWALAGVTTLFDQVSRGSASWSWAFVTQVISSATSLGLSLLAGRALGAHGLGIVFAGFTMYLILLALHRALVITPLISSSSMLVEMERLLATRTAMTVTLTFGGLAAGLLALLGTAAGGPIGDSLLIFAPWLVPAFVQELLRSSLFRDGRSRQAATIQVAWLGTMVICAPLAIRIDEEWAVVGAWGLGSIVAALSAVAWMRAMPMPLSVSRAWFLRVAFPFARWLVLQEGSVAIGTYGLILILTAILGAAGLGGLRAADSIFVPFTLLAPAMILAGVPAVSRTLARSHESAVHLAARISGACVLVTLAYSGVMLVAGSRILTAVFGESFEPYGNLVVPMSIWQLALTGSIGFGILLLAEQRGRAILVVGISMSATSLVASSVFATLHGVRGAVWGLAVGGAVGSFLCVYFGLRAPRIKAAHAEQLQATTP